MVVAQHIRVSGVVQGVGFRPFVWRLARELSLAGWVRNGSGGVEISAEGTEAGLRSLVDRILTEAPPQARVEAVLAAPLTPQGWSEFTIAASVADRCDTAIGVDTAVCDACLSELFDPENRRWRHAFITCTNCGPRFTITHSLPYDRSRTSMERFALCADCQREYVDPDDRRFHAEPIACPACGPRLRLTGAAGDPIESALALLRGGAIVALKSLGGYHLACDARNPQAVGLLRARKDRDAKPFAVMAANPQSLAPYAQLDSSAVQLLESPARPVVLVPKGEELVGIAPGMACLGVMLPSNPLQWLLFHEAAGRPAGTDWLQQPQDLLLVMTSANPGGEPLVVEDSAALEALSGIADAYLQHDRPIVARCDDSVVIPGRTPVFVRRARGYAPRAIRLPVSGPSVLAVGAHLKNTVCVTRGDEAFVSPHVGDLDDAATCQAFRESIERLLGLLEVEPALIAHDLHPDMFSTRIAESIAAERAVPAIAVQHHHAHIASVLAEHRSCGPALGIALDGVGFGLDGSAWGGELLAVEGASVQRVGHLECLPLPGGDRAAREPWRLAAAALHRLGRGAEIESRFPHHGGATQMKALLDRHLNCPPTSSMGRVFDAAAALLGVCEKSRFEAEAAMRLEACARRSPWTDPVPRLWSTNTRGMLDLMPLLAALADWNGDPGRGAALFHAVTARAVGEWAGEIAARERLSTIVLSGGCFLNTLLFRDIGTTLSAAGFNVLSAVDLPPNDGGISLGQALVALQSRGH
jgi:hydrogenase maturation protein HypF